MLKFPIRIYVINDSIKIIPILGAEQDEYILEVSYPDLNNGVKGTNIIDAIQFGIGYKCLRTRKSLSKELLNELIKLLIK